MTLIRSVNIDGYTVWEQPMLKSRYWHDYNLPAVRHNDPAVFSSDASTTLYYNDAEITGEEYSMQNESFHSHSHGNSRCNFNYEYKVVTDSNGCKLLHRTEVQLRRYNSENIELSTEREDDTGAGCRRRRRLRKYDSSSGLLQQRGRDSVLSQSSSSSGLLSQSRSGYGDCGEETTTTTPTTATTATATGLQRQMSELRQPDGNPDSRREIELRVISAQDLKKVRLIGRMRTYAVAYVDGADEREKMAGRARTRVDEIGGRNPVWNDVVRVFVEPKQLQKGSLACLTIDIFDHRSGLSTSCTSPGRRRGKLVGSARIFLSDVLKDCVQQGGGEDGRDVVQRPASPQTPSQLQHNPIACHAFWIRLPSGEPHGILNVWIPPSGRFLHSNDMHHHHDIIHEDDMDGSYSSGSLRPGSTIDGDGFA